MGSMLDRRNQTRVGRAGARPSMRPFAWMRSRSAAWRDDLPVVPFFEFKLHRRAFQHFIVVGAIFLCVTEVMAATTPPLFPDSMDASEIQLRLEKLNVLGRVLYLAAHP